MDDEDTMLSRATAGRAEKLTIIAPLTIRQTESLAKDIQGLADLRGMEKSEYIRHLVQEDKKEQHRVWLARNQLFSNGVETATDTANGGGLRE